MGPTKNLLPFTVCCPTTPAAAGASHLSSFLPSSSPSPPSLLYQYTVGLRILHTSRALSFSAPEAANHPTSVKTLVWLLPSVHHPATYSRNKMTNSCTAAELYTKQVPIIRTCILYRRHSKHSYYGGYCTVAFIHCTVVVYRYI